MPFETAKISTSISPESSELFRKIVEHSPVPMCIIAYDGTIEFVNKKLDNIFGYHVTDVPDINTWFLKAYPDEAYRANVVTEWTRLIEQARNGDHEVAGNEYAVTCNDGTVKNIYISGCTVFDKTVVMFFDMSSFRQMEKALQVSEQHYKMISELTTDYVFRLVVNKDGSITMDFISDNYGAITGRNKENSGVNFWSSFIHPDDLPGLMEELRLITKKPQSREYVCRSFIQGDKLRWVQVFSRSEWDPEEQRITSIVGAVKNITERKQAEAEILEKNKAIEATNKEYFRLNEELRATNKKLKEAKEKAEENNRLKTSFLQNMSHEIRTPMNAIMGFASLLPDNYNNKVKLEKYSKIIYDRCNDLLEIINDILDISKIESGQMTTNISPCDISELFSELLQLFNEHKKRINKENIEFNMRISEKISNPVILTDQIKLKQILINLIGNAYKFTDNGSIICTCSPGENEEIIFCVADTGIGIPKSKHKLIFQRFVQLDDQNSRNYGGTGLGLSIVKGLIHILGGHIWLESTTADPDNSGRGGSKFYFSLPVHHA